MAAPGDSRPNFVAPSAERFPLELPSQRQRILVRVATVAFLLAWVAAGVAGIVEGSANPLWLAGIITIGGYGSLTRYVSLERTSRFWFVVRVAWFGDRAKPSRTLREHAEYRERSETALGSPLSQITDQAAREHAVRAAEIARWVADGMLPQDAPDATLVSIATDMPMSAEFSERELAALLLATGAPANFGFGTGNATAAPLTRAHVASETSGLIERGVLRRAGTGTEIAPNWMPLLGVALFAEQTLPVTWRDGEHVRALTFLAAGDHLVVHERTVDQKASGGSATPVVVGPHHVRLATVDQARATVAAAGLDPALLRSLLTPARPAPE